MAQQQPQPQQLPQMPARPFSPAQPSPSPVNHQQQGLAFPPNNQARLSPNPSPAQTASPYQPPQPLPYQQQQFAASPAGSPMNSAATSPSYGNMALPQQNQQYQNNTQYQSHAPYQNGATTPNLTHPDSRQGFASTPTTPLAPASNPQYTPAMLAPMPTISTPVPATPGVMGPPSKPAERPTKEYEYDATDSLAGTGINIRDEEQALADYYAGSFGQDSRYGFPANPAGGKSSFYGAGLANQPAQPTDAKTQEKMAAAAAERAWNDSAHNLASIRASEINNPCLNIAILNRRAAEICKKNDINLNLDPKTPSQPMGKFKPAEMWSPPELTVTTKTGPDGALVHTTGAFLPHDAFLVDQLALLSLATKHRVREKLEEGFHVATVRQKTAHGAVPADWVDVAAPIPSGAAAAASQDSPSGAGGDSAVSPRTNSLKRPLDATKATPISTKDNLSFAIRKNGDADREVEDARLRKRQKRVNPESATSASRAGSVAPGTPGTIAPEPDKILTKKELREQKKAAGGGRGGRGGISDTSTATANQTLQHMMGGFGGRKKGKQYSWMTAGASGASTPTRLNTTDLPGTPGAASNKPMQQARLTIEGKQRLGTFREDGDKGKQIQLRDWLTVMEIDGLELKAIQDAYIKLDSADSAMG
ncbi:hypothetical protein GE09DRAFT_309561 [Coniochaeta sp. 2T2.1]|nr:hypothetical protein GE09DRAFT_309561 [Coniochaeta sp. 2T2.1]